MIHFDVIVNLHVVAVSSVHHLEFSNSHFNMYIVYIHDQCLPQVIKCPLKRDHFKREGSVPSITIFQGTCEYFFSSLAAPVTTGTGAGTKQPGKTGSILEASVKKGIWGFYIMFHFDNNVRFVYIVCIP